MSGLEMMSGAPEQTRNIGGRLAKEVKSGDVISLSGDLGAGKTVFVQGLAEGLGVEERVTSPTFTIIKEYSNGLPLYHLDVYRLKSPAELVNLGYEEYFYGDGVSVVEWGDRVAALFPPDYLEIVFERLGEHDRLISFRPKGERWKAMIGNLLGELHAGGFEGVIDG